MILIRNLALALFLVLLSSSYSNGQIVATTAGQENSTGNLINFSSSPTAVTSTWQGAGTIGQPLTCWSPGEPGYCGPLPGVAAQGPGSTSINFSYGLTDVNQMININNALAAAGTGVQVSGFNFSFMAKNGSGWDNGQQDYLSAYIKLYGINGAMLENYSYDMNRKFDWTTFVHNETFNTPYTANTLSKAQVGFIGGDSNFWAGFYGPEINNVSFSLRYKVDPCTLNPAFSPSCAGFRDIITSINVVPYPTTAATQGHNVDNSFPIATVLANSGSGLVLHGFRYGFTYNLGTGVTGCTAWNQDGSCSWYMNQPASANVNIGVRDINNQIAYSNIHSFTGSNTGPQEMNYQYLFPQSTNTNQMSNFSFVASASGEGSAVYNMYSKLIVTKDPCIANPYYSPSCTSFQEAVDKLIGTNKTDYATTGYTEPASVTAGTASNTVSTFTSGPAGTMMELVTTTHTNGLVTTSSSNTSMTSAAPSANNPQPKVGEIQMTGTKPQVSLSTILNILNTESSKVTSIERQVVQAAEQQAFQIGQQTVLQAESIANILTTQSTMASMVSTNTSLTNTNINSTLATASVYNATQSNGTGLSGLITPTYVTNDNTSPASSNGYDAILAVTTTNHLVKHEDVIVETPKTITNTSLTESIDLSQLTQAAMQEQSLESSKRNIQPNDLAVGVDIANIARQPVGYQSYFVTLADAAFYAPKEVYKNQVNVDNTKAMRQLSTDKLHQTMVDQQYKGN